MTITLYDMPDSPYARKVRLLAAELGIPLEIIERDPRKGETRSPEYLTKNPNGRVPVLEEDGFVLWESPAILKYLAAKRPARALGGGDARTEGLVNQWLFWWIGGPEPAIDALLWERVIKPKVLKRPGNDPAARLSRFLPVLDRQLERRDYVIGPLSIADFAIGPRLDRDPDFLKFDVAPSRNISAWLARLAAMPYWATA